jgi:hypothetical protein
MSGRGRAVLERFPNHLAATDPGKRLGAVVEALAADLDVLTVALGDVRAAHRIDETPALRDLLALAALHGLGESALTPLVRRLAAIDPGAAPGHEERMRLRHDVIRAAIGAHTIGNGTPAALLHAAAGYAGLRVARIRHAAGRWWHIATCADDLDAGAPPDVLALEENPFRRADIDLAPKRNGQRTRVLRGGLDDVSVTLRVRGRQGRTVRPMIVHLEAGQGVVLEGNVPDGAELDFAASGQVTLSGLDVTGSAWTFTGGVFADANAPLPGIDATFAAPQPGTPRQAVFAVSRPLADAFDDGAPFPHGGFRVGPMTLPRGQSHWTALVRTARTGAAAGEAAVPRTVAGRFDASVFGSDGPPTASDPSMELGFRWEEREPFAARVLLPRRLAALDDDAGSLLAQPLRGLLDRHRAAGVEVRVEYADPRWQLGTGVVRDEAGDPLGVVVSGTELWPDGSPQPTGRTLRTLRPRSR